MRSSLRLAGIVLFVAMTATVGAVAWIGAPQAQAGSGSITDRAWACVGGFLGRAADTGVVPAQSAQSAGLVGPVGTGVTPETGFFSFFSGGGAYMPRTHCMVNEAGETDWPWVIALLVMNALVIAGYLRIFIFWRRAYLSEALVDRNKKLMDLAWIFLWCAVCGYAASIVTFVWPAYRLIVLFLIPLAFFTWKFCGNLDDVHVSLSARRLQRELHEAQQARTAELEWQVAQRTKELERARDAERAANEAKSAFVASVSHEIRTPLNAIMGYSDLIAGDDADIETRARYAGIIRRNGDHLATVINDVLDVSKIEAGGLVFESVECDLAVLLGDIVALLGPAAHEKGITISGEIAGSIPDKVMGDPTRIRQILLNLASNAVKFTETGGVRLIAGATPTDAGCVLTFEVVDTGIGMSPDQIDVVFKPFMQAEPGTTRRFGGTGLGLSISRSLAKSMGGSLRVRSEPGAGSVFTATIVVGRVPGAVWSETLSSASPPERAEPEARETISGRVLVADDSVDNRRLFTALLEGMGLETDEAGDGETAVRMALGARARNAGFDIVLMDIDMPRCDGETAMKRIREQNPTQVIIALTAHSMAGVRTRLLEAGFDDYATKPIHRQQLRDLCRRWIDPTRRAA